MYPYAIGLDIGITSVGWATLALDADEKPFGILNMGTRIFDAAEHPKNGASLAAPRREARGLRRRLRRHRHRNERIRNLIVKSGLLTKDSLDNLFLGKLDDIYQLRVDALTRRVSNEELARIMLHISQRRGFRSNRKNSKSVEDGKILEAVNANRQVMQERGYRTVAELILCDDRFAEHKRNKGGNYISTVTRDMVEEEVHFIFSSQRKLGNNTANEELENSYLEILLSQRSFDDGPAEPSPYAGSQIENMMGRCTFESGEIRAPKASYSFEYFNLLEQLNHLRLVSSTESRPLTEAERKKIVELAFKSADVSYEKIRKELSVPDEYSFNLVRYDDETSKVESEKKTKFSHLKAYHQIRKAFEKVSKGSFSLITHEQINAIARVLTVYKSDSNIRRELLNIGIDENFIDELSSLNFSKTGHLSVKASDKIIPFLEKGMNYSDACTSAGYNFKAHDNKEKSRLLKWKDEDFEDITSPVVRRAVSQTIKVINAIIREYDCSPTYINIELAREMSKNFSDRHKIETENNENRKSNERIIQRLKDEFHVQNPTGQDLVKFKLWEEQEWRCAYSLKPIKIERLFETGYAEVDHIVPYSISFDDTLKNKALVLAEENRNKGNRLPLQYLTGEKRDNYIVWVNSSVKNFRKRNQMLKEKITEDDINKFKERNLQDTKYISSFLLNYLRDNLIFADSAKGRKNKVTAVNGMITSYMRKRWGITKIREDGDLHHAVDAVVIGCTSPYMIQQITRYAIWRECQYSQSEEASLAVDPETGEVIRAFPYPWPMFRKELDARICNNPMKAINDLKIPHYMEDDWPRVKPLFVSRMPKHSVSGAAHKETVKSTRILDEGYALVKVPLTKLKLKNGEIENYYNPGSDILLYDALKARLIEFDGKADKAFAEPFHKPKSDGTPGPLVNKVKIKEPVTITTPLRNGTGMADNDTMVRIDVFKVEGDGYYFVPIYVADTLKKELPSKACISRKKYEDWKPMRDEDFVFSLYANDLVEVTHSGTLKLKNINSDSSLPEAIECKSSLLYFKSANIAACCIGCITNDNTYQIESLGIKTLKNITKYTVDVLGNYFPVKKEKRRTFK